MIFEMISRLWQIWVNGNLTANASLIQHVKRYSNQFTLLGSNVSSTILSTLISHPILFFDIRLISHLFLPVSRSSIKPLWTAKVIVWKRVVFVISYQSIWSVVWCYRVTFKLKGEMRCLFQVPKSKEVVLEA